MTKQTTRQVILGTIGAGLLLAAAFFANGYFASKKKDPPTRPPKAFVKYVEVQPVSYIDLPVEITAFGRVSSTQSVTLTTEVQGRIVSGSVPLKSGQSFRRGQLLFRVFDDDVRLAMQASKSGFLNRVALMLPDMKLDYPEAFPVWNAFFQKLDSEEPLPALPDFASERVKVYVAASGVLNEYYAIRSEEERLKKYRMYAPYGSISAVYQEVGGTATPGQPVADIFRTDDLELALPVPANQMERLRIGQAVLLENPSGEGTWKGRVVRIGEGINPATQSIDVYVTVQNNPSYKLYEGIYLRGRIQAAVAESVMAVPRTALYNEDRVYLLHRGRLREERPQIVFFGPETALIRGLPEGDSLVVQQLTGITSQTRVAALGTAEGDPFADEPTSESPASPKPE